MERQAEELESLFAGNTRSHGRWDPKTGKTITVKDPPDYDRFLAHLQGKRGLGIVPIRDDGSCTWGALDIDCHGDDEPDIDIVQLDQLVRTYDLPLLVCRSKSGGAHCYLFVEEPVKASVVRSKLTDMARVLGYPKAEVFPKQSRLIEDEDGKQLGNFINLPFFDHDNGNRYAIVDGERVSTEQALASVTRITKRALLKLTVDPHEEAPPCLQYLMREGVGEGHRNEYLYNLVIYMKKAFPDDYRDRVREEAANSIVPAMPKEELERTLKSASRRDYPYKCKAEPCASHCNVKDCRQRKHGIGDNLMDAPGMPQFGTLVKYDPMSEEEDPTYCMTVDKRSIKLTLDDLMSWKCVRKKIVGKLNVVPPDLKQQDWELVLTDMLANARVERSPDSITAVGEAMSHLARFLSVMMTGPNGSDMEDHNKWMDLDNGHPIQHTDQYGKWVCFRGESFMQYLRRAKCQPKVVSFMWQRMGEMGLKEGTVMVDGRRMQVVKISHSEYEGLMKDNASDFNEPTLKIVNRIKEDEEF